MNRASIAFLLALLPALGAAEPLNYDVVNLDAEARAEVANDLLQATLFVEMTSKDAASLAGDVNRTLNQGSRLAKEFPSVKVSTGAQSTWPVYDAKNRLAGWRTRAELRIEGANFDDAARVIAKLQETMQLENVRFALAPATREATANRLVESAVRAFQARADLVARALGAKSWRVVTLNLGMPGVQPPMPTMRMAPMMAADAAPPQEMAGGDSAIAVTVNGTVQLER